MNSEPLSLNEQDYLDILSLVEKLESLDTRKDLKIFFVSELMPKFGFDSGLYGWTDSEIKKPQLIDVLNIPEDMLPVLQKWIPNEPISKKGLTHNRPVVASDVDIERQELAKHTDGFIECGSLSNDEICYLKSINSALVVLDLPDLSLGIAFHRLSSNKRPISNKEVRMLDLLRPHLIQAVKTIILSEELSIYRALIEKELGKSTTAIALVGADSRVLYRNDAFDHLFSLHSGEKLHQDLIDLLQIEVSRYKPPYSFEAKQVRLTFYTLPQGRFRLSVTILKGQGLEDDKSMLIRLKPVTEPYVRLNKLLQENGVTDREIEVCALVKDGVSSKEASSRLLISVHTVKNHLKSIYKKLNVHNRAELVVLLNLNRQE